MVRGTTTGFAFLFALSSLIVAQQKAEGGQAGSIVVEAESLAGSVQVTHGKAGPQDMRPFGPGWGADSQLFWAVAQVGAQLRLAFTSGATGRYEIFLHFTRAPDYALVRASFDGAPTVSFNGYAPTVSRDRALLAMRDVTPGVHELLIEVTMKDGQSTGLNVGLDRIELAPVNSAAPASAIDRRGVSGQPGFAGQAAAAMIGAGTPPVPVLRITAAVEPQAPQAAGVEPLPMAARLSVVRQATSQPLKGLAGQPLRLTASNPRIVNRAALSLYKGFISTHMHNDGWIDVPPAASFSLSYFQVEPRQPQLLDCGVKLDAPAEIVVSPYAKNLIVYSPMGASKVSLPGGEQRLLSVIVPTTTSFTVVIQPAGEAGFGIRYCELTAFK